MSVRWTGLLKAPVSEKFTLSFNLGPHGSGKSSRGGVVGRVYVDDDLVLESGACETGVLDLTRGVLYDLRVEYFAPRDDLPPLPGSPDAVARCQLLWESDRTPRQPIPSFFLYPASAHIDASPMPLKVFEG